METERSVLSDYTLYSHPILTNSAVIKQKRLTDIQLNERFSV